MQQQLAIMQMVWVYRRNAQSARACAQQHWLHLSLPSAAYVFQPSKPGLPSFTLVGDVMPLTSGAI